MREQQTLRPSVETPGLPAAKLEVLLQGMRYVRHHLGDQERGKRGGGGLVGPLTLLLGRWVEARGCWRPRRGGRKGRGGTV